MGAAARMGAGDRMWRYLLRRYPSEMIGTWTDRQRIMRLTPAQLRRLKRKGMAARNPATS